MAYGFVRKLVYLCVVFFDIPTKNRELYDNGTKHVKHTDIC